MAAEQASLTSLFARLAQHHDLRHDPGVRQATSPPTCRGDPRVERTSAHWFKLWSVGD